MPFKASNSGSLWTRIAALLEKSLQEPLSFGRATQGSNWICRYGDHKDHVSLVDPHETISLMDLIPLADRRRNIRLAFLGDGGFHRILLGVNSSKERATSARNRAVLQGKAGRASLWVLPKIAWHLASAVSS
jgi:hypothetical protein